MKKKTISWQRKTHYFKINTGKDRILLASVYVYNPIYISNKRAFYFKLGDQYKIQSTVPSLPGVDGCFTKKTFSWQKANPRLCHSIDIYDLCFDLFCLLLYLISSHILFLSILLYQVLNAEFHL